MKVFKNRIAILIREFLTKAVIKDQIYPSNMYIASNYIYTQDIEGDYLEFGCFRGESFIDAYYNILKSEKEWQSDTRKRKAY